MKKRVFLTLLIAALLTGCSGTETETETTETVAAILDTKETSADDVFAYRQSLDISFTQMDCGGQEFCVLAQDGYPRDIVVEEMTGEVINDAVYTRNQQVHEQYNITITWIPGAWDKIPGLFEAAVLAGDTSYDLLSNHALGSGALAIRGVLMNMYEIENIDFSYPWWSESILDSFSYHNTAYLAPAEMCLSVVEASQCIFFNTDKADDYGLTDLYNTVRSGKWTIDTMIGYTNDVYEDTDGNGTADATDFYGLGTKSGHANLWWYAFDEKFVKITDDGIEPILYNDKITVFFEKIMQYYKDRGVHCFMGGGSVVPEFANGNRLFVIGGFDDIEKYLRGMDNDFGVLPMPKYNEEQEQYLTVAGGAHSVIGIPKNAEDFAMTGLIVENLNYLSYKDVTPVYCNTALKSKYTRDNSSMEMIDLVLAGRVFDFGYLLDNWQAFAFVPQNMIQNDSTELASTYASKVDAAQTWWNSVAEAFESGVES